MIGLLAIFPMYGWETIVIAIAIYFGVRVFVGRRKKQIQQAVGEGICAVCGEKITDKKCPTCDASNNT